MVESLPKQSGSHFQRDTSVNNLASDCSKQPMLRFLAHTVTAQKASGWETMTMWSCNAPCGCTHRGHRLDCSCLLWPKSYCVQHLLVFSLPCQLTIPLLLLIADEIASRVGLARKFSDLNHRTMSSSKTTHRWNWAGKRGEESKSFFFAKLTFRRVSTTS